jgi:hypothetical protein
MAKRCLIAVRDEVYCYISGLDQQDAAFLDNKFAFMVEGAFFMPLYKLGRWDGKVRFFDQKTGKIYLRLLPEVLEYLEAWGYDIDLNDSRKLVPAVTTHFASTLCKPR